MNLGEAPKRTHAGMILGAKYSLWENLKEFNFFMGELGILKGFSIKYLIFLLIIYKIIHFILNSHIIFVVEIPKIEIRLPNSHQFFLFTLDFYPKFCGIIFSPQISTKKLVVSFAHPSISTKFWLGSSARPHFQEKIPNLLQSLLLISN